MKRSEEENFKSFDKNENSKLCAGKKLKIVQKFRHEYTVQWPSIVSSSKSAEFAFCTICSRDFSIAHGGRDDCKKHLNTKLHKTNFEIRASNKNLNHFLKNSDDESKVTKAELLFTAFIVEHNLPISCSDHASQLFKKMFPDSKIAMKYGCGRTKTCAMLKDLAISTQNDICENLKVRSFSLATDGSTDNNESKIYPIVVSYFSKDKGKIVTMILSLVNCTDNSGEGIFNAINEEFEKWKIPWENCVAFAADNARVMNGQYKGVLSFIRKMKPNICYQGCACHLLHLAAKKGCAALKQFNVEQFLTDIYYFLQKSSKRQHSFRLCQNVFGLKPHKIFKYVSTRWLSLFDCVGRVLEQWDALNKFFSGENEDKDNTKYLQIKSDFENPTSKLYLLFLKNVLPLFVKPNTFLQQEKPLIHKLNKQIYDLYFGVLVRFVKPSAVDDSSESLINLNYRKSKNQKSDTDLVIGGDTRCYLKSISDNLVKQFYSDVRDFYVNSADYIKKKLPLDDPFLHHAAVADVSARRKMMFSSIEFLVSKFPYVLSDEEKSNLEVEFSMYQFENFDELDHENLNIDEVWHKISQKCDSSGEKKYPALSKLILAVILVPHSNAATERVFSIIRKNQTDFRPTLGTETLTSLLIEKYKNINSSSVCYERQFSEQQLKSAKQSTWKAICSKKTDQAVQQVSSSNE